MKSVWRARKAGVWSTSTACDTGAICGMSWTSVRTGTPSVSRDLREDAQPFVHARAAKALVRRAVGLVEARLEDEQDAELVGDSLQRLGRAELQVLAFDHARAGDEEEGLIEPDVLSEQLHGSALAKGVDDRHGVPVAKTVLRAEIWRKRLSGVDSAGDEDRVEAHFRRAQDVGLKRVADREHLVGWRIAGEAECVPVDRREAACRTIRRDRRGRDRRRPRRPRRARAPRRERRRDRD